MVAKLLQLCACLDAGDWAGANAAQVRRRQEQQDAACDAERFDRFAVSP